MSSNVLGGKTPTQCLSPSSPIFPIPPKIFGCVCFVHIPKQQRDKVDAKAEKCIFVGYPSTQKGYKCYLPGKNGRHFVSVDVTIFENTPIYSQ